MLKLGVPCQELLTEMEALRLYKGNGMAKLIDADPDNGILILERVQPGNTLTSIKNDEEATLIAAQHDASGRGVFAAPLRKERILAWAYCHSVLSAWWRLEDNVDGAEESIQTALLFETLLHEAD